MIRVGSGFALIRWRRAAVSLVGMGEGVTTGPVNPRELRVSDAEREHVVGLLQKAIGQGLIDLSEFTDRTDTALAARTRGELNAVLVDLPGMVHRDAPVAAFGPTGPVPAADRLELTGRHGNLRRAGRWVAPREIVVRHRHGSVLLDFTEARIDHPQVHVSVELHSGRVVVVVPPGSSVNTDGLTVRYGQVQDRVEVHEPVGRPHFVITGAVRHGNVRIQHPGQGVASWFNWA